MLLYCRNRWLSLGLTALVATGAFGMGDARAAPSAAAFDTLFSHLDDDATVLSLEERRRQTVRLKALVPPGDVRRDLRYKMLSCVVDFEDMKAGFEYAKAALAQARQAGDRTAQIRLQYCEAGYRETVETPQTALAGYEAGLALAHASEDSRMVAEGLVLRGGIRSLLGDQALALLDFMQAQQRFDAGGYRHAADANLQNIAIAYRRMGQYDQALEYLKASRENSRKNKRWDFLVLDLLQLGFVYESLQQPDQALAMYREAEQLAKRHTWKYDLPAAHLGIAGALLMKRKYDEALRMTAQASREFTAIGDTSNYGMIELYYGQARAGLGQHTAALAHFDNAARDFEAGGNERYLALLYPERAASLEAVGRMQDAVDDTKRFLALREVLRKKMGDQRTMVLRYQFDAARRDDHNRRLEKESTLREQQVSALVGARRWQWIALGLGLLLIVTLGALVYRQVRRLRRLRALALTDELTGVANRRSIELFGEDALDEARQTGSALTALTVDIDRFKSINDTYGHATGDEALIRVARACQGTLRQFDRMGRVGGEEFLVLLPDTDLHAALPIAERLRRSAEALALDDLVPGLRITLSIGAAALKAEETDLGDLTRRADEALYRAKRLGRNRVEAGA